MITLLKHEFIQTRTMLAVVAGAFALTAFAGALLAATGWPVIIQLGTTLVILSILGLVPVTQIFLAIQYWRTSYGRAGHLTQALPFRSTTIYWAKMLWAWLVSLVMVVVGLLVALPASELAALGIGQDMLLRERLLEAWATLAELAPGWGIPVALATVVAMILIWPTQYFFAASVGSQAPLNRLGFAGPVLVWIGVYVAVQIIVFASFAVVPVAVAFDGDHLALMPFDLFAEMAAGNSGPTEAMPVGFIPGLLLSAVVCLVWTSHSWKRRVSLV